MLLLYKYLLVLFREERLCFEGGGFGGGGGVGELPCLIEAPPMNPHVSFNADHVCAVKE